MPSDDGYPAIFYCKPLDAHSAMHTVEILNLEDKYEAEMICAWLNRANQFGELLFDRIQEEVRNLEYAMPEEGCQEAELIEWYKGRLEAFEDVIEWIGEIMNVVK